MYDIPGVVFDQPLNIPAAFLCIGVWAAAVSYTHLLGGADEHINGTD